MGRSKKQQQEYENALRLAKNKLEFILDNAKGLLRTRGGAEKLKAAENFWDRIERIETCQSGETFTSGMFSYIDGIYEMTCKGSGLDYISRKIDKKRKGIRYGHA